MHAAPPQDRPTLGSLDSFDTQSGSRLERLVFNNRRVVIAICAVLTLVLGLLAATRLSLSASFEKMIPHSHPYIQNYLENRGELRGLGNALRIVVENPKGDIYDPKYQNTLKQIHDEIFLTPGVDRAWVKSLWAPGVRWTEVTEEGFRGGPVMPDNYNGSPAATEQLRGNIARASIVGSLVGNDFKSSMLVVPLLDTDPATGKRIDYRALSHSIEKIRDRVEAKGEARMHVIGFAKLVGDLIDGLMQVALYFGLAAAIATAHHLAVHPLRALHRAGDGLLAGGGGLAARAGGGLRLRARPVFDPGAVPRVRHRRQPRRAEDERHHAGHRGRRAPAGGRALHLPPPVPGRA